MSFVFVVLVVLSAAPVKLAAPGLGLVHIDEKLGSFFTEHLAQQLKLARLDVVTQKEMQAILGCGGASRCMAELASALGADGMVLGDIAQVGERFQINLKIIASDSARTLAVFSESVSTEDQVIDALTRGAYLLAVDVNHALGRPPPPELVATDTRVFAVAPLFIGVLGVAGGVVSVVISENAYQKLKTAPVVTDGPVTLALGQTSQSLSVAGFVVGGVALVGAAGLFLLGAPKAPVSVAIGPGGAAVMVRGEF